MEFPRYRAKQEIVIRKLVTCYYFELAKDYAFEGEKHDFWEFMYLDKGELLVETDDGRHVLRQGDLLFLEPNLFHGARSNGTIAPNLFIVSFECRSGKMTYFKKNRLFHLGDREKGWLALLMQECERAFGPDTAIPPTRRLVAKQDAPFGGEQLFVMFLETLLILLIRNGLSPHHAEQLPSPSKERQETGLAEEIIGYMKKNLGREITVEHLCSVFMIGKTHLSIIFKKKTGSSVMEYVNHLKIEKAKKYIREDNFNFTEIAELLGYGSVHYFSKHFKKRTGSSPSEYANILKSRLFKRN
ncbi:helix-turn-helix domain-containing protein [Paenibacillus mesophilus]|uniref:AraC family transcriptional regulator n=1 Tax=Paenibacillus mesophilus TaxID=2582849 RepID=UPI00110DADC8|nr:AraC family transcriptional regulator [Paenibacillus mesophilus]TMV50032.1 helix-turn-helix domain-containing protein [Paenibacillus mesophilus]